MFRSVLDHPQGDIFFTSVTKHKLIGFVVACLLFLLGPAATSTQQHIEAYFLPNLNLIKLYLISNEGYLMMVVLKIRKM